MSREEFGRLVAALRKQMVHPATGGGWTQRRLAEETGLSTKIISDIECGRKIRLEPDTLGRLMDAFGLTPPERREFLLAASGVEQGKAVGVEQSVEEVLEKLLNRLGALQLPAYLHDPLGEVIAVNERLLAFHAETAATLSAAPCARPLTYNLLRFVLDPRSPLRSAGAALWRKQAAYDLLHLRATSLRYRHTGRFGELLDALWRAYPEFHELWRALDKAQATGCVRRYTYRHPRFGPVRYTIHTEGALTAGGELYLSILIPADLDTLHLLGRLSPAPNAHRAHLIPWHPQVACFRTAG